VKATTQAAAAANTLLRRFKLGLLAVLLGASTLEVLAQDSLVSTERATGSFGRLFFSPERRAALNRHRQLNLPQDESLGEDNTLTLNGIIVRQNGRRTAWINGVPVTESSSLLSVQPRKGRPGSARVAAGDGSPATLNVGSTLNRGSGKVTSGLGDGSLRVRER
jgi:hypothetical protein